MVMVYCENDLFGGGGAGGLVEFGGGVSWSWLGASWLGFGGRGVLGLGGGGGLAE